ncbi:MAG: hypothetical protein IKR86_03325 [Candidatus Methanomethylophilaceae archaeon]|nr:hypothetical protein [Candidatus Methanomethylophilaceae archaeon]MBR4225803.1 hypothetical protein [Candidatus Methanomethylophilaceae archaeon]
MFFRRKKKEEKDENPRRKIPVESFSTVKVEVSGMCIGFTMEAVRTETGVQVSKYSMSWTPEKRLLLGRAECGADEFIALLNECDLIGWNGFVGERPPGLLDGDSFVLEATVNGDLRVSAHGSGILPTDIGKLDYEMKRIISE